MQARFRRRTATIVFHAGTNTLILHHQMAWNARLRMNSWCSFVFRWWTQRPTSLWPTRLTCAELRSLWQVWCLERVTSSQSQQEIPRAEANPSGSTHSPPSYQINWPNPVRSSNVNRKICFGPVAWLISGLATNSISLKRTLSKTADENLDCAFVENPLFYTNPWLWKVNRI